MASGLGSYSNSEESIKPTPLMQNRLGKTMENEMETRPARYSFDGVKHQNNA